jgi:hypothetical protein
MFRQQKGKQNILRRAVARVSYKQFPLNFFVHLTWADTPAPTSTTVFSTSIFPLKLRFFPHLQSYLRLQQSLAKSESHFSQIIMLIQDEDNEKLGVWATANAVKTHKILHKVY